MKRYLVIGATSAIAQACCREWLRRKAADNNGDPIDFYLVGRTRSKSLSSSVMISAGAAPKPSRNSVDLADTGHMKKCCRPRVATLGSIDVVLIAHGTLPDQIACQADPAIALREFYINGYRDDRSADFAR
jgi:decaprenylphospho-beta-D-erythro-pentofuranosid-2-ulose 2-reductase